MSPKTFVVEETFFLFRNDRRKELKARYWFDCRCSACLQNWPILDSLPKVIDLNFNEIEDYMKNSNTKEAIEALIIQLNEFDNCKLHKCENLIRAEDKLRTCINNYGNIVIGTMMNK